MKSLLYIYKCKKCGTAFKAPTSDSYGEFVMRSEHGELVYLFAIKSDVYLAVGKMIDDNPKVKSLDEMDRATILQEIFGIACDLASDGTRYQITNPPICPNCQSNKMASWTSTYPSEFVDEPVKSVTHLSWNKLTDEEKNELVNEAVSNYLKQKNKISLSIDFFKLTTRVGRIRYLGLSLLWGTIAAMGVLLREIISNNYASFVGISTFLFCLLIFMAVVNNIFLVIRRLNDFNYNGWWILLWLIPILGGILFFATFLIPGSKNSNRFGKPPSNPRIFDYLLILTPLMYFILYLAGA